MDSSQKRGSRTAHTQPRSDLHVTGVKNPSKSKQDLSPHDFFSTYT